MIGERLADIRKDHGDTQQALAEKLGVSKYSIQAWEQEKGNPSIETFQQLCELYNVSADFLLGLSDMDPLLVGRIHTYELKEDQLQTLHNLIRFFQAENNRSRRVSEKNSK